MVVVTVIEVVATIECKHKLLYTIFANDSIAGKNCSHAATLCTCMLRSPRRVCAQPTTIYYAKHRSEVNNVLLNKTWSTSGFCLGVGGGANIMICKIKVVNINNMVCTCPLFYFGSIPK